MKARILLHGLIVVALFTSQSAAHACAVCLNGAGGARLTDAFNWSVIFLMAMPYTILFSVVGFFVYSYRRAARKARAAAESAPPLELAWIHKESGR
jgi:heme/copper-type cytochrome/quinol oxidase subunit 2